MVKLLLDRGAAINARDMVRTAAIATCAPHPATALRRVIRRPPAPTADRSRTHADLGHPAVAPR